MKISARVLVFLATVLLSAIIALQIPAVQGFVARKALSKIQDKFDGKVEFSSIAVKPFSTLVITDLALVDENPWTEAGRTPVDTVFSAESLTARFTLAGLVSKNGIKIKKVTASNSCLTLTSEPGEQYKNNITRVFRLVKKDKEKSTKELFSIKKADLDDFRFRLISYKPNRKEKPDFGMNWSDLDLTADIEASGLKFANSIMTGTADKVSLYEKSGYYAKNVSGSVRAGRGLTEIKDIHLTDRWSDVSVPVFSMEYPENSKAFKNFTKDVKLHGEVKKGSVLAFRTLSYFVPALKDNSIIADISSGEVNGYVNNLSVRDLCFSDRTSGTGGCATATISGAGDIKSMAIDAELEDFRFSTRGLGSFLSQWMKGKDLDLASIAPGEDFVFNGSAEGSLSRLRVDGRLGSRLGAAEAGLVISGVAGGGPVRISGDIGTDDLDLGGVIGKDFIHEISMKSSLSAELAKGSPSARIDTLQISRLNILGYDYSNIMAAGTYSQQAFDGRIICGDPNLNFMFQGLLNLGRNTDNARYRFFASLGHADLNALNIDTRGLSRVSVNSINADYTRISKGDLTGTVDAAGIRLENDGGRHDIGDLHISSRSGENSHEIRLSSAFADGTYTGTKAPGTFIDDILDITARKEMDALFGKADRENGGDTYRLDFNLHDSRDLLSFVAPGAYVADSTSIRLRISESGGLRGRITSPRIALNEKFIKGLSMEIDNDGDALNCTVTGSELRITPSISFKDNAVLLYAHDNSVGLGYSFNNGTELENRGEFYLTGDLAESSPGSPVISAKNLTSNIYLNGENWRIEPAEYTYSRDGATVNELRITNEEQVIVVEGGLSKTLSDSLLVNLENLNLTHLNSLVQKEIGVEGLVSGKALLTSPLDGGMGIVANITSESTSIAGHPAGTLTAACFLDGSDGLLNFAVRNSIDGHSSIDARGTYATRNRNLDANAALEDFDLGYASPFLQSVFSETGGRLSGTVSAGGPLDMIEVNGSDLQVRDGLLRIAFTNVPYYVSGPLRLDNSGVYFDNIAVRDRYNGSGTVSGGIGFNRFKNLNMNTSIRMDNIECLNTSAADNSSFYGNVFGTGRMSITGPFNALRLDIEATTTRNGSFHIPLNSAGGTGTGDLLVFVEPEKHEYIDPYDMMMNTIESTRAMKNDMGVRLKVNATPVVEASLEVDKASGNVLTGRGSGTISLDVRPSSGSFNINGDYTLNSGNYHFSALGIANKDFSILDGSSIKFNGDIMDSDLDIEAQYSTKTSLSSLIADTTSVSSRRNVECGISITDKLSNPQLAFSINVPDLDPATKSRVESALSTDDKIQKQFIALLVTNNFIPDDQSGIVNNTNLLYSNVADIMSNQLNNILERLEIPLDLGLKYQENGSGSSIFDVALSTQLFNNRVSVNGNIGNRQYMSSGNGDVVGDLDIEIKMDRNGEVRLNLFSHSADAYTNYLDDSQRNGIGVAYQKEFNSIRQFIKDLFTPKAVRQARVLEDSTRDEGRVTINIE